MEVWLSWNSECSLGWPLTEIYFLNAVIEGMCHHIHLLSSLFMVYLFACLSLRVYTWVYVLSCRHGDQKGMQVSSSSIILYLVL